MLDPDIRFPLARSLRPEFGLGRVLGEVGIWGNSVRIDLARLTPSRFDGYEIKSDGDTLARLRTQSEIYGLVFDTMTLVAARRHLEKAMAIVPEWWGLTEANVFDGDTKLTAVRLPLDNPSQSAERIAGLLWKDEAVELLQDLGEARGLSRLRLADIHARLARCLSLCELRTAVFAQLVKRRDWLDRHDPLFVGPFRPRTGVA